ncbi:flagellar hook-length control protein FliK [Pseudoalteromonas sp. NEC-BIFX-2020_002]|nr:flagellar hook-length control protein FliK [Pseudoalteromonas sp. NEC-BIFX-2020_002]
MTSNNLTNTAQEIKNQVASSSQYLVKEAAIADKAANILPSDIEIEKASKALLNSQSATEIKSNPVLANLTDEQRKTLQSQAAVIVEEGVTPAKLDTFKQYITELVNKNEKVAQNTVEKPLLMSQSEKVSKELDVAIGQLNNADKQALRTQLQQFLATAQPKGAALNNVTAVIDKLDQLHVAADTQKSEKVIPPQSAQVLNSTAASIVTSPEASKAQTSQEALIKSVTQEAVVKSETQQAVIKDALLESHNKEQVLPRESAVGRINQLFGQITGQVATLAAPIAESSEQRYQQEITDMQVLQAQQASPTSQTKQVNLDPTLLQALNIVKSDAAKLLQERVSALLSINNKEAEIRLDPPEMGSMQIRIRSDAEQAQINFVVQNQQAKEALEQSMPKLREMLAQQGIELGESSIEQGNSQNGSGADEQSQSSQHANNQQKNESESTLAEQNTRMSGQQSTSSIDYYA